MQKIKAYLKTFPLLFWIYAAVLVLSEVVILTQRPAEHGLYIQELSAIPSIIAFAFFIPLAIKKSFKRSLYFYSLTSLAFLVLDYYSFYVSNKDLFGEVGHAELFQIALTVVPIGLFWLVLFVRWNFGRVRESSSWKAFLLCAFSWGLYAIAYPPMPLGPAALLLLIPWFIVLNKFERPQALFATFWSSVIYNTINYYWISSVMNVETAPSILILIGLFIAIATLSTYNVLAAYVYTIAKGISVKGRPIFLWLYPLFFAGIEMTRTTGDFSFPWSHLGFAFGNHLTLLQALPWIGIFGYTALIVFSNQVVASAICKITKEDFKNKVVFVKKLAPSLSVPIVIIAALFLLGNIILSKPEAAPFYNAESDENPSVAMVQPSIEQGAKWSKERFDFIVNKSLGMIRDSVDKSADLILLAETAIPEHLRRQPGLIRRFQQLSAEKNASILVGALDYKKKEEKIGKPYDIYNASFLFTPGSNSFPQRYIKKHLVPFSERIPFDDIFPILNYVDLGEGDFVPGTETPVYEKYQWTPYICYDAIFGDLVREAIRAGSRLMVNITNDGWFGRSTAPYQHVNLVRYRAIENGMPVARLANSGISLFIDQYGHYDMNTDLFVDAVIQRKVPLRTRDTLYSHIGDSVEKMLLYFFFIYLLSSLILHKMQNRRKFKNS